MASVSNAGMESTSKGNPVTKRREEKHPAHNDGSICNARSTTFTQQALTSFRNVNGTGSEKSLHGCNKSIKTRSGGPGRGGKKCEEERVKMR